MDIGGLSYDFIVGVGSTFATILIFRWLIKPKIKFSKDVRVIKPKSGKYSYIIIIRNDSKYRTLIDVRIRCRLHVKNILNKNTGVWNIYDMVTTFNDSLVFKNGDRRIQFSAEDSENFVNGRIYKNIIEKYGEEFIYIPYIFLEYKDAYLKFYVIGNDRFTGFRHIYESQKYFSFNFNKGTWRKSELERSVSSN